VVELLEVVERMQSTPFMIEVDITSQRMFQVLNGSFISSERDFDQRFNISYFIIFLSCILGPRSWREGGRGEGGGPLSHG